MSHIGYYTKLSSQQTHGLTNAPQELNSALTLIQRYSNIQIGTSFGRVPSLFANIILPSDNNYLNVHSGSLSNFKFLHARKSEFSKFFLEKQVSIPKTFARSDSIRRPNAQKFIKKFLGLLQRSGQQTSARKMIIQLVASIFAKIENSRNSLNSSEGIFILQTLSNVAYNTQKKQKIKNYLIESLPLSTERTYLTAQGKNFPKLPSMLSIIRTRFRTVRPLYQFRFAKVDKRIRKFSRGKIGKYQCMIQYIPKFRRNIVLMKGLINEINFNPQINGIVRADEVFDDFLYNPKNAINQLNSRMLRIAYTQRKHKMLRLGQYRIRYR